MLEGFPENTLELIQSGKWSNERAFSTLLRRKRIETNGAINDYAKSNRLSCGGDWIMGKDFCACFVVWANTYDLTSIEIYTKQNNPEAYSLLRLCLGMKRWMKFTEDNQEQFEAHFSQQEGA